MASMIQTESVWEKERMHSPSDHGETDLQGAELQEAELRTMRDAAMQLAARLGWLPKISSSDTFARRYRKLTEVFQTVFKGVDAAFRQAPGSEDLLWLRDNAQQLSSAARPVADDLGPLTHLPHVGNEGEIVPRVLAVAEAFFDETDDTFFKNKFKTFCLAFDESTPLQFHEIGALVPALKLALLERIASRGRCLVYNPTSNSSKRIATLT